MPLTRKLLSILSITALLFSSQFLTGCGKSEQGNAVKETVEELSGKNIIDKGERLKKQINDLGDQQVKDVQKRFDQGSEGQEPGRVEDN